MTHSFECYSFTLRLVPDWSEKITNEVEDIFEPPNKKRRTIPLNCKISSELLTEGTKYHSTNQISSAHWAKFKRTAAVSPKAIINRRRLNYSELT